MPIPIIMPQMGESVVEGTISKWHKKEGEKVKKDEPLVEIETDKITVEVPCPVDGTLVQIFVKEGETVPVGAKLAILTIPGEEESAGEAVTAKKEEKTKILREPEEIIKA